MDVGSKEIYMSRNVIFYQNVFCNLRDKNSQIVAQEGNDFMRYVSDNTILLEVGDHTEK